MSFMMINQRSVLLFGYFIQIRPIQGLCFNIPIQNVVSNKSHDNECKGTPTCSGLIDSVMPQNMVQVKL